MDTLRWNLLGLNFNVKLVTKKLRLESAWLSILFLMKSLQSKIQGGNTLPPGRSPLVLHVQNITFRCVRSCLLFLWKLEARTFELDSLKRSFCALGQLNYSIDPHWTCMALLVCACVCVCDALCRLPSAAVWSLTHRNEQSQRCSSSPISMTNFALKFDPRPQLSTGNPMSIQQWMALSASQKTGLLYNILYLGRKYRIKRTFIAPRSEYISFA